MCISINHDNHVIIIPFNISKRFLAPPRHDTSPKHSSRAVFLSCGSGGVATENQRCEEQEQSEGQANKGVKPLLNRLR